MSRILRPDLPLAALALALALGPVALALAQSQPLWWPAMALAAVPVLALRALRRLAAERDTAVAVMDMIKAAAPALSRASFDAARAAIQAHEAAQRTTQAAHGVADTAGHSQQAAGAVETAAAAAHQTLAAARNSSSRLGGIGTDLASVLEGSLQAQQRVGELAEAIRGVEAAAATIEKIAVQTRLLALNATIEAAHAGEAGKGFAVVAQEVRKLSDDASGRAKDIRRQVQAIIGLNTQAVDAVRLTAQTTQATTRAVQATLQEVSEAVSGVSVVTDRLQGAQGASEGAARAAQSLSADAHALSGSMTSLGDLSSAAAETVSNCLERLLGGLAEQGVDCEHTLRKRQAQELARQAGLALERLLQEGQVPESALFSPAYQDIPRTDPPKKTTGWDALTDRILPPLQEPLLDAGAVYAIVVNADGYCPTHNQRFSQPLTGDHATDLANNRTKRIFDDAVGRRCAAHQGVLVQTYLRDTGQTMHDLSVPLMVRGRHWGAVRVGYLAAQA